MKEYLNRVIRNKYLVKVTTVNNNCTEGYVQSYDALGLAILAPKGQEKAIRWDVVVEITTIGT